jgi:hypothetical protein
LADANLHGVYVLAGWIPILPDFDSTVFCIDLSPHETSAISRWHLYFSLPGRILSEQKALAFVRGHEPEVPGIKLEEFALCFPPIGQQIGRIELFRKSGVEVYDPSSLVGSNK